MDGYEPWGSDYYVIKADMTDKLAVCPSGGSDKNVGLYVAIGVLGAAAVVAVVTACYFFKSMKKVKVQVMKTPAA